MGLEKNSTFICTYHLLFFKVDVFTINIISSRIDYVHLPCFWRILYCLNHILQLWRFYLFVLANLHSHFTLAEGCSNTIFYSVLPLRVFQEQPVLKEQLNYPVITFCFINFIPKFSSTMDTITPCNTPYIYQGSPVSIYKMCANNNQACLFSVFNFSTTNTHYIKLNIIPDSHCFYHV